MADTERPQATGRWQVMYTGGPYGGVAWLTLENGTLALHPTYLARGSGVPQMPHPPERPLIHRGTTLDAFHARWRYIGNGSILIDAAVRSYLAVGTWRQIGRDVLPVLQQAGFDVRLHVTRFSVGNELAAARFFPGLAKDGPERNTEQRPK